MVQSKDYNAESIKVLEGVRNLFDVVELSKKYKTGEIKNVC